MHDLSVRLASAFLCSGVLLFLGFLIYSALYPRKVHAAVPAPAPIHAKDYGMLAPVARPLEWTVREIKEHVTRSWGWSIVATTFLINALLFPFKILAARSASRMKAIKPMVDAISARYKSSDPEHSRQLTELYREQKVNPLGGCIPMLAPFAVLAAFYSVIRNLTELQGAHWLWIADLSRPEQLPVRILPVLMIATQLVIGKITPPAPGADPRMTKWLALTPLIFGVMFYGQPSALMLYWLTSNLLTLGQQWWLGRRFA
jgi:YidC/Oxa1 family membrane protein insertase